MITGGMVIGAPRAPLAPGVEHERPAIVRKPNWPLLLRHWIDRAQSQRFVWGQWDCCLAMADAIRSISNCDPGIRTRGQYDDAVSAARFAMRLAGVSWFEGAVAAELRYHRFVESDLDHVGRGDVVMGDSQDGPTWGVVDLTGRRVVFASVKGARWADIAHCRRGWRVG